MAADDIRAGTPMDSAYRFSVPAADPVLAGHFPDDPIVPGSLILMHVLRACGQPENACLVAVKFHRPLGPDQEVTVVLRPAAGSGCLQFRCLRGTDLVCSGRIGWSDER